jgi:hypothetical protein
MTINDLLPYANRDAEKKGTPPMQVSPIMLLKTHIEKMSLSGLAIMFMKTKYL